MDINKELKGGIFAMEAELTKTQEFFEQQLALRYNRMSGQSDAVKLGDAMEYVVRHGNPQERSEAVEAYAAVCGASGMLIMLKKMTGREHHD